MTDITERLRDAVGDCHCGMAPLLEAAEVIERVQAVLRKLDWKSIDKDNMEYGCRIPYNVMDEIRRVLEPKP